MILLLRRANSTDLPVKENTIAGRKGHLYIEYIDPDWWY
jgi:hypothetical protein